MGRRRADRLLAASRGQGLVGQGREGQILDGHSEARGAKGWPLRRRHRAVHAVSMSRLSGLWEGPTTPLEGAEFEVVRDDEPVKDEV